MRIAILGATSQIAKDLVLSFHAHGTVELLLYARRPEAVKGWLSAVGFPQRYTVAEFEAFTTAEHFDAILNFIGVGNPAQFAAMGASIFDVTLQYDGLALSYVQEHPSCRYIFLSSGAAYGSNFEKPVDILAKAQLPINNFQQQDWYGAAKLNAECRHRSLPHLPIVDIRVFNYFSHTQNMSARFLMTDVARAIRDKTVLQTSNDFIVRDYIHPEDFYQLVIAMLQSPATNVAVDAFSKAPIEKPALLSALQDQFGLSYELSQLTSDANTTGNKPHYYSLNRRASDFGFEPKLTSLEGVILELDKLLLPNF